MTRRSILSFSMLLVLGDSLPAAGQGRLLGVVQTTSGLPLPAAEILVQSESTGARWKTLADAQGKYFISALPSGRSAGWFSYSDTRRHGSGIP